jgi:demethylspheroidene O-methyltransferase
MVGNPAVGAMVEHHSLLYADLHDPVGLLRGDQPHTELAKYWTYSETAEEPEPPAAAVRGADYTTLMANSQPLVAEEILDAYPLNKHRCLLDVGGGDGSFVMEVSKHCAQIRLMLFDLPAVAQRAAQRFKSLGLGDRARAVGGDFLTDSLPSGADVVSLVRVIHDHDDEPAATILSSVYKALPAKGVLLLAEPMMGTPGAEPVGDAYFGFYLLAMGRGKPRTPQSLRRLLRSAGFASTQLLRTRQPLQSRLIVARKG